MNLVETTVASLVVTFVLTASISAVARIQQASDLSSKRRLAMALDTVDLSRLPDRDVTWISDDGRVQFSVTRRPSLHTGFDRLALRGSIERTEIVRVHLVPGS